MDNFNAENRKRVIDDLFLSTDEVISSMPDKKKKKAKKIQKEIAISLEVVEEEEEYRMDFYPAQNFHGYEMNFLKSAIYFNFKFAVELMKTRFNYHIKGILESDKSQINAVLKTINVNLKMHSHDAFINGKEVRFINDSYPGEEIQFVDKKHWKLCIKIQGFNVSATGRKNPIWSITEAQFSPNN
jgi:hypothetical protein